MRSHHVIASLLMLACSSPADVGAVAVTTDSTFQSDGAHLAYSITWPAGDGPFPGVVLVHGSGPVTRQMQASFAARFAGMGYAVLSYDKRGSGASGGQYSGVNPANSDALILLLARDAARALAALAAHPRIEQNRLGFAGGSQAGWIIPPAVDLARGLATWSVILVGPTVTVGEEIFYSNLVENGTRSVAEGHAALRSFSGTHGFDPLPYVQRMRTRTLWLYGAEDRSIPTEACLERHGRVPADVRSSHTVRSYPGLGHSLDASIWRDVERWLTDP